MAKKRVNLAVYPELLLLAKERRLNLSSLFDAALRNALADAAPPKPTQTYTSAPVPGTLHPSVQGAYPDLEELAEKVAAKIRATMPSSFPAVIEQPKKRRWFWQKQG